MSSINKDLQFCNEYLRFCKSIKVQELDEQHIAVTVQICNKKDTLYIGDYACDLESVFMHFYIYNNDVKHK